MKQPKYLIDDLVLIGNSKTKEKMIARVIGFKRNIFFRFYVYKLYVYFFETGENYQLSLPGSVLHPASKETYIKNWTAENEPLGKSLGYPACCINEFCQQPPEILHTTYNLQQSDLDRFAAAKINNEFTGFIPCAMHAAMILSNKITLQSLITNRNPSHAPFPSAFKH